MARIWHGLGMTYGHQVSGGNYNPAQTTADLTLFWNYGIRKLRIAYTTFNPSSQLLTNLEDICTKALSMGFTVQWGFTAGSPLNLTQWTAYKAWVIATFVPIATSLGITEMSLGNEEELHASKGDGSVTPATIRSDLRAMCSTIKSGGYAGKIVYNSDNGESNVGNWAPVSKGGEGTGTLDAIYFNIYGTLPQFTTVIAQINRNFGGFAGVGEFSSPGDGYNGTLGGYNSFNNEGEFYSDTAGRIQVMKDFDIPIAYIFTWMDGAFGLPTNVWGYALTTGGYRHALWAALNDPTIAQ